MIRAANSSLQLIISTESIQFERLTSRRGTRDGGGIEKNMAGFRFFFMQFSALNDKMPSKIVTNNNNNHQNCVDGWRKTHSLSLNLDNCTAPAIYKGKCYTVYLIQLRTYTKLWIVLFIEKSLTRQRELESEWENGREGERDVARPSSTKNLMLRLVQWKLTTCCHSLWNVYWAQLSMRRQNFSPPSPSPAPSLQLSLGICLFLSPSLCVCTVQWWRLNVPYALRSVHLQTVVLNEFNIFLSFFLSFFCLLGQRSLETTATTNKNFSIEQIIFYLLSLEYILATIVAERHAAENLMWFPW